MPALLTTRQAAIRLSCTPHVIRELCQAGKLKAIKIKDSAKSHWRIETSDLEDHIKAQKKAIKKHSAR